MELLEAQSKETKVESMREDVWEALTLREEGVKMVAVNVGWRVGATPRQSPMKGTTFGLLDDGSMVVEKEELVEEFFVEDEVNVGGIFERDYVEEELDDADEKVSREIVEKQKLRESLPVLVISAQRPEETLSPLGEFTGLGADGMWYRFDAHRIVSTSYIGAANETMAFSEIRESCGNPPSNSSIRWRRLSKLYRANGNAKTSASAANLPGTCEDFSLFEEDVDTADYLELQRKKIEQIQIDLGDLSNIGLLRREMKLQKKRRAKSDNLSERTRKLESRIQEYSAAGWDDFMRVVDILEQRNALMRVKKTTEAESADEEIEILTFGEVCMAFRGENELWIGTVLSSLPDTISVANLAGVCGAMSSDANRAVNAYYGPSEELDTILASFVPDLEDIADLQYASRIDNAPLSLSQDLAALLEQWASGVSWSQIRGDTSLQEGDIARVFKRTAELLAQIPRAPHVSEQLKKTAKEAERIVNRPPISDLL